MVFHINDVEWFKKEYGITNEQASVLFGQKPFECTYIITGKDGGHREQYELYDSEGKKIDTKNLNGYERSILWRCDALFFKDVSDIEGVTSYDCSYEEK